jgi:tetratricopeptide (TPR) repeat protein
MERWERQRQCSELHFDLLQQSQSTDEETIAAQIEVLQQIAESWGRVEAQTKQHETLERALLLLDRMPASTRFQSFSSPFARQQLALWQRLAQVEAELERWPQCLDLLDRILHLVRQRGGHWSRSSIVLQTLWQQASVLVQMHKEQDAGMVLDEVLDLAIELYGEQDCRLAFVLAQRAWARAGADPSSSTTTGYDHRTLKRDYVQALGLLDPVYGPNHPLFVYVLQTFALASERLGDGERARKMLEQVVSMTQNTTNTDDNRVEIQTRLLLARCLGRLEQYDAQFDVLIALIDGWTFPSDNVPTSTSFPSDEFIRGGPLAVLPQLPSIADLFSEALLELGRCQTQLHRPMEAQNTFQRLVDVEIRRWGSDHVLVALDRKLLGQAQFRCAQPIEALHSLEQSLDRMIRHWGREHPEVLDTQACCAVVRQYHHKQQHEDPLLS